METAIMKSNRINSLLGSAILSSAIAAGLFGSTASAKAQDGRAVGCQHVRGGITDTEIPSPNDPLGRVLGNVDGVLNGAETSFLTSSTPDADGVLNATSFDVFVTNGGDMLTATCANTLTPVPGKPPGDSRENATLTITGGSGKYAEATGTITLEGRARNIFGGPGVGTFNLIYRGSVCGPNIKADRD
jgi:hypothetical protein